MALPLPPGPLQRHAKLIAALGSTVTLEQAMAVIDALDIEDPWLQGARVAAAAAAPGSLRLAWGLQRHPAAQTLAGAFRSEYVAALYAAAHGDFAEGIRALLIDKDRQPRWNPPTLQQAGIAWAQHFFREPWPPEQHPLRDL